MEKGGWLRDTVNPLRELFDVCVRGRSLRLTCGCGRTSVLSAHAVWLHFRRKGFSERIADVARRFRCADCGRRGPDLRLVHDEPTDTSLPLPSMSEWKRELSHRR